MAYSRVEWRNEITPVNADNMNRIEDGIEENMEGISALNTRADGLSDRIDGLIDVFYPVGSYYETSDTSFDPNTAWGGTWAKDSAGRVTVAIDTTDAALDTIGERGGSKFIQAHNHAFTQPTVNGGGITNGIGGGNHSHNISRQSLTRSTGNYTVYAPIGYNGSDNVSSQNVGHTHNLPSHTHSVSGGAVGVVSGASTGNAGNMQPYIVVNRWHRTA